MAKNYVLALVKDVDKLSTRCDEIDVASRQKEVSSIVTKLKDTLIANKGMMALSAPQLGYDARIFCIRFSDGEIKTFVNPMITKIKDKCLMIEQTPSLPGREFLIERPERILVGFQTPSGKVETDLSLKSPLAPIFSQMVDMLDGTLFFKYDNIALEIDKNYYKAPEEEKKELHEWYLNTYVPEKMKQLQAIADGDKEISDILDARKFLTSVLTGETEVVPEVKGELDFEHSSRKEVESQEKFTKEYEKIIKDKFGVK